MKKLLFLTIVFCCVFGFNISAQEHFSDSRKQKQLKVEQKVEKFIQNNLETVDVTFYEKQFKQRLDNASPEERKEIEAIPYEQRILRYKKQSLRKKYLEQNMSSKDSRPLPPDPAPICAGGDFENGQIGSMYAGYTGIYSGGECDAIPQIGHSGFFSTNSSFSNSQNFQITSGNADPIIGSELNTSNGSGHALRINAPIPCSPNGGINKLVKAITLPKSGIQTITFKYAFVAENPENHIDSQPFFVARAVDPSYQNEFDRICVISNANDPFLNNLPSPDWSVCPLNTVVWRNWTCATLEVSGQQGDVIYLEFIVGDCGLGQHFGYAYIDDICIEACPDQGMGSIDLNETNPCDSHITVSGCFTPPVFDGETAHVTSFRLDILAANGTIVTTLTSNSSNPQLIDNCFNWTLNPSDFLSPTGGYDFKITAFFSFYNTSDTVTLTDQQAIPGLGNDYIFNYDPSADFTASISNNGIIQVTGFTNNSITSNEWYVVSSPNQNSGPYTPVTSTENNNSLGFVLYNNAQPDIYYTVIHRINTYCGSRCVSKVYYYNEALKPFMQGTETSDCCLAFEFWPNGPDDIPSNFTGEFNIGFNTNGTITTANIHSYPNNPDVTNTWTLYSSINLTGGPYVLVDTASGPTYSYPNAEDQIYYFLIHTVESSCSTICYLQSISRNPNKNGNKSTLEGIVPCDIFGDVSCRAPQNIVPCAAPILPGRIEWDPTYNTGGYMVEIIWNDPNCGTSRHPSLASMYQVSTNWFSLPLNHPSFDFFRVRVGTICDGDTIFWSHYICSCIIRAKREVGNINIYPNPTNGAVQISFQSKELKLKSITVLNVKGVKKAEISVQAYKENEIKLSWDTQVLGKSGIYFLHFYTNGGEKIIKKLIVK